ncbi:MAG TPA: response regulator transcription factor [Pyrinomonadaceae bacterium]|nr:response regulator transcription factor [Pyrinomonadaceae bacterium]
MKTIQVVLADDHALVRAGIRALLERIEKVEVVGEAGNGQQALDLIEELDPDVVLLDLTMPGLSGFEVLKETSEKFPDVNMIVLSVHDSEEYAFHALRSGAVGYLPKSAASTELEAAIHQVLRGEKYLSPSIAPEASLDFSKETAETPGELTPRQMEVLTLIAHGSSTREVASTLSIAVKTVETHRAQLMERLNIHDVAGLVRYAIKKGLVNLDK